MAGRSRCLIFDPFSGVSGDMILGGLIDLGLSLEWLQELVGRLPVKATVTSAIVQRGALQARAVEVKDEGERSERRLSELLAFVEAARLDARAHQVASTAFRRLAEVEAGIHGVPPDQVHFHELGAVDTLVDIIAAAAAVTELDVESCFTRPVAIGRGWITAAHGALPVPAPATLRLLEGIPVYESDLEGELTTPTGAVLLGVLTEGRRVPGTFLPLRSAYGAGSRNPSTHPNCLRLTLAELEPQGPMCLIEADIDDMSPEYMPVLMESLRAAGATDVWAYPTLMKKGRLGQRVEALAPAQLREEVSAAFFRASTTLGLRFWHVERQVLPRGEKTIEWRGFPIRIKTSQTPDGHVRCKPEYDDVIQAARALGVAALDAREAIERLLKGQGEVS